MKRKSENTCCCLENVVLSENDVYPSELKDFLYSNCEMNKKI